MAQRGEVFKVALQDETKDATKQTNKQTNKQVQKSSPRVWKPCFSKHSEEEFLLSLNKTPISNQPGSHDYGNFFAAFHYWLFLSSQNSLISYSITTPTGDNDDEK